MRTPVCNLLGIQYPILSVGFMAGARAELVSAVSNAGGFGVLGSGDPDGGPDVTRSEAERTRTLTERPFGFNLTLDRDHEEGFTTEARAMIAAAAAGSASAAVLFWGDPAPYVETAHEVGMKLLIQVGSVEEAERRRQASTP